MDKQEFIVKSKSIDKFFGSLLYEKSGRGDTGVGRFLPQHNFRFPVLNEFNITDDVLIVFEVEEGTTLSGINLDTRIVFDVQKYDDVMYEAIRLQNEITCKMQVKNKSRS